MQRQSILLGNSFKLYFISVLQVIILLKSSQRQISKFRSQGTGGYICLHSRRNSAGCRLLLRTLDIQCSAITITEKYIPVVFLFIKFSITSTKLNWRMFAYFPLGTWAYKPTIPFLEIITTFLNCDFTSVMMSSVDLVDPISGIFMAKPKSDRTQVSPTLTKTFLLLTSRWTKQGLVSWSSDKQKQTSDVLDFLWGLGGGVIYKLTIDPSFEEGDSELP